MESRVARYRLATLLAEATLAFPHPNGFGASRAVGRQPQHAECRAKHCETNTDEKGTLLAEPLKWGGSSDFVAFAKATALINLPAGNTPISAGTVVGIARLPG